MSIPYGPHYGASFKDAVLIFEALSAMSYPDDPLKEKDRIGLLIYTDSKLKHHYPYQWDDYFLENPTAKRIESILAEHED